MATVTLRPTGAGSYTQHTPTGAANNWDCVNDSSSDSETTYVTSSSGSFSTDMYTIESNGIGATDSITSVTIYTMSRYLTGTHLSGAIQPGIYENFTESLGTTQSLTGSYALYSKTFTVKPSDSTPFSKSDIDVLEIGQKGLSTGAGATTTRTTQTYVVVDYVPTGASGVTPVLLAGD